MSLFLLLYAALIKRPVIKAPRTNETIFFK